MSVWFSAKVFHEFIVIFENMEVNCSQSCIILIECVVSVKKLVFYSCYSIEFEASGCFPEKCKRKGFIKNLEQEERKINYKYSWNQFFFYNMLKSCETT